METRRDTLIKSSALTGTHLALFLALVHAVTDGTTALLGAMLPLLQARFDMGQTVLALLVATYTIAASVTQPFFGALAEERGLHVVCGGGVLLASFCLSLLGVAPSLWLVVVILLVGGLGSAALHPAGSAAAAASTLPDRTIGVGIFTTGGMIGFALGPVLVLVLIDRFGAQVTPWVMAPGIALSVLASLLIPRWEPRAILPLPDRLGLRKVRGPIGSLVLSSSLTTAAFLSFTGSFPMWLVSAKGIQADAQLIGWTLAAFSLSAGVGSMLGAPLVSRLGRRCVLIGSLLLAFGPLAASVWVEPGSVVYFASVCSAGVLTYMGTPVTLVIAQELSPGEAASISGVVIGMSTAIGALIYVALGLVQDQAGLGPGLVAGFALVLPAAAITGRVFHRYPELTLRRPSGQPDQVIRVV